MTKRRVVITGMAAITSLGDTQEQIMASLKGHKNTVRYMEDWDGIRGLRSRLYATLPEYTPPAHFTRKQTRTMSSVSIMAVDACERALQDAGLLGSEELSGGRTGVAAGSCSGSMKAMRECIGLEFDHNTRDLNSTTYVRFMGHTVVANMSLYFRTRGRLINSSTACTSGSIAVGASYELIQSGKQDIMIACGAEVRHLMQVAVFDTLFATSTRNDVPHSAPAPFDTHRDGLVLGEGACTLILEELEHARARGAHIYAEIVGYSTNTDGAHVTSPNAETMAVVMRDALADAGLSPDDIDYVSAHGTSTVAGDVAETTATRAVFNRRVPVSSLKSYTGHTLGACGALETMVAVMMMNEGWFHPTLNLHEVDPKCGDLDYIVGDGRCIEAEYVMNNNFAFAGINTSLILKKWKD